MTTTDCEVWVTLYWKTIERSDESELRSTTTHQETISLSEKRQREDDRNTARSVQRADKVIRNVNAYRQ
ncbi:hypothetical protein Q1695_007688 [Nippostrongylus brasiliensis]|nr:hypothetical protein Q1695_007688 [Nippostrongylus brasiliensis]